MAKKPGKIEIALGRPLRLAVSGGFTVASEKDEPDEAVSRALAALQEAREQGGNCLFAAD